MRNIKERAIAGFFFTHGIMSIAILGFIFFILFWNSLSFFAELPFYEILSFNWNPEGYEGASYGVLSLVWSSLLVTFVAMILAIPLGILSAVYLVYLAPHWFAEILKPLVEFLAAIPSVVIGFLGVVLIGPIIAYFTGQPNGLNVLNGGILLSIMALPTIVSISEDSLRGVPRSYLEASYALGATKWKTLWRVAIPSALSGIIAAIMLGLGRAVGETMTVLMVTGNAMSTPSGLLDQARTLTATIAIEMGEVVFYSEHYYALFMVGLVLFIFTFVFNTVSYFMSKRFQQIEH